MKLRIYFCIEVQLCLTARDTHVIADWRRCQCIRLLNQLLINGVTNLYLSGSHLMSTLDYLVTKDRLNVNMLTRGRCLFSIPTNNVAVLGRALDLLFCFERDKVVALSFMCAWFVVIVAVNRPNMFSL